MAVPQRAALQPHSDPVAAVGGHPNRVHQRVGVDEPVVARSGQHLKFDQLCGDRRDGGLVEFGIGVGVLADRKPVSGL
ncbi:Uncharacterised protein [Mycobacterium tuberculosis]|nr:Uncharacterised protein [Mycobacterium tuberculosis]